MSPIAVERNKRKQMTEHLKVVRSLTPYFYIERGDQASITGGIIEFIKELQLLLQAMESKKQRKRLSLSPRPALQPIPLLPCPNSDGFENFKELSAAIGKELSLKLVYDEIGLECRLGVEELVLEVQHSAYKKLFMQTKRS